MNSTCLAAFTNCSGTFENAPPAFARLGCVVARRHTGWAIRFLPCAAPERRWRAQTRRPLTWTDIALGRPGALHAPTLAGLESRLRGQRLAAFLTAARGWRR